MKKNISINISGIIFHIEEDGYEVLKKYLDSITKYFSTFEDSSEIMADIESRIAELFLGKLNEGKQVITKEDVKSLITTMGNVSDFQAAEEPEFTQAEPQKEGPKTESGKSGSQSSTYTPPAARRLFRDQKRKILGGVCAGLGNYFNVDPVWIRLLFAFLTLAYGVILIVYIVLWIVVPGSYDLEEPEVSKKLFRDPERKVLGGVAGGLAAYFAMDIAVVRLLFILLTIFGGLGLVAYIVLWIVLPEAHSITDKMQMQGEPVTLSNIESSIKKNLDVKEGEENAFVKVLLFPFRLLGWILTGLGKILNPLVDVLRVGVGIIITLIGMTLVASVLFAGGILLGFFTFKTGWFLGWEDISFPMEAFSRAIPSFTVVLAFIACLVPGAIIALLGISVIVQRIVLNATVGWTLFILFFLSAAVLSATIPKIAMSFKEDGEYKVETTYALGNTGVLRVRETGLDDYDVTSLSLKGYEGKELKLVQYFEAQGTTRQQAAENAKMVEYTVTQEDTMLIFDSNIRFKDDAIFRAQRLKMTLYIPYDFPFVLDDNMWRLLSQYIDYDKRDGNTWVITKDGWLKCVTCPESTPIDTDDSTPANDQLGLEDFRELDLGGVFDVHITRGNSYSVELVGPDSEKNKYRVYRSGQTLVVEYDEDRKFTWKRNPLKFERIRLNITMPELERLEIKGAGQASFTGFTEDDLEIEVLGALEVRGEVNARELIVNLSGASELTLIGEATNMDARVLGASELRCHDFKVQDAIVDTSGASKATVYVTGRLEIHEGIASNIDYRGNPAEVIKD